MEVSLRITKLARDARELAETNLDAEREKFGQGLSSASDLSASERELASAEQSEGEAIVAYLNALARLDTVTGKTLERWGIVIEGVGL